MGAPSWNEYFMNMAMVVASRSKDHNTKVGCVLVDDKSHIRATGYNGFPRGIDDDVAERYERPEKYFWTEHAERNAIYAAARVGVPLEGCSAYVTMFPCMDCARAMVQSGITKVTTVKPDLYHARWGEDFKRTLILFDEAGVIINYIDDESEKSDG